MAETSRPAPSSTSSVSPTDLARAVVRSAEVLPGERVGVLFSGGRSSALLWRVVRDHRDDAVPVFVETGLHPLPVHDLLHRMYRAGGFPVDIRRNDPALRVVAGGRLRVADLPPDQAAAARAMTTSDSVPYSLDQPVVRHLFFDEPMAAVHREYDVLFDGARWEADATLPFMERVGHAVAVHPLLGFSLADVDAEIGRLRVPVAEESVVWPPGAPADPTEELVERAMAMAEPARSEYVASRVAEIPGATVESVLDRVRAGLALWKGGDRFGHG